MSRQSIYPVFEHQKKELLLHLVAGFSGSVVVFVKAREETHAVATALLEAGVDVDSIHGKMKPEMRDATFQRFTNGDFRVLVVTDATARALELSAVEAVVHYDFAELEADYKARAASAEVAVQLSTPKEAKMLERLEKWVEKWIGEALPQEQAEGFGYDARAISLKQAQRKTQKKPKAERSKPLQHKKKKLQKKKFGR